MDPISEIKARLSKYPHLRFRETSNAIEVESPSKSGFSVGLTVDSTEYTVHLEGWHEHFESAEKALNCFAMGLSGECRLEVTFRGNTAVRYKLQIRDGESWTDDSVTGLIFQPFWRTARTEFRQNPPLSAA